MTPVDGLSESPTGRDPDMIENELFFDRTYEDKGYENEEIGVITVNEREND